MKKLSLVGLSLLIFCSIFLFAGCDNGGVVVDPNASPTALSSYKFISGTTELFVMQEFSQVKDLLGEPVSYRESASCGYTGLDMFYQYKGFELTVNTIDGKDHIISIFIIDDTVSIPGGLKIGDTEDKIASLVGDNVEKDGNAYNFKDGNTLLQIIAKDGVVKSIEYKPAN